MIKSRMILFLNLEEKIIFYSHLEGLLKKNPSWPILSKILQSPCFHDVSEKHIELINSSHCLFISNSFLLSKNWSLLLKPSMSLDLFVVYFPDLNPNQNDLPDQLVYQNNINYIPFFMNKNDELSNLFNLSSLKRLNHYYDDHESDHQFKKDLIQIYHDHNQLNLKVQQQLQKIKFLHEIMTPKRVANIRGLSIYSKFNVGEQSGGEFFDVLMLNKKLMIFLSSCHSYLFSSLILKQITYLKKLKEFHPHELKLFVTHLYHEVMRSFRPDQDSLNIHLLVGIIDTKTLLFEGLNFGMGIGFSDQQRMISANDFTLHESFHEKAEFSFTLTRGEKMIFLSPGVHLNTQGLIEGRPLVRFLQNFLSGPPQETLNELFLQLKKRSTQSFLPYDASAILIEVGQNVLLQTP
jgi:hypothetical protein